MLNNVLKILEKAIVNDTVVYDVKSITPYYDYVVIASVNSNRQGAAAINYLKKDIIEFGGIVKSVSSSNDSGWFLIDLNDIIVHIFVGEERKHYNLDGLYFHLPKKIIE